MPEPAHTEVPAAEEPSAPQEPTQAPPAWRTMRPRRGRKARETTAPAPAPAGPPPPVAPQHMAPSMMPVPQVMDPTRSWATWMRTYILSPPIQHQRAHMSTPTQHLRLTSPRLLPLKYCKLKRHLRLHKWILARWDCSALDHAKLQCTAEPRCSTSRRVSYHGHPE